MTIRRTTRKVGRPRPKATAAHAVNRVGTLGDSATLTQRYDKLDASAGYDPLDFLATRRFLLGQRRFGKTILIAGQRETAYLDFDCGSFNRAMGAGTVRFPIKTYQRFKEVMEVFFAEAEAGKFPFRHVVFDTIDTMRQLVRGQMSDEINSGNDIVSYGKGGKGYDMLTRRCLLHLNNVTAKLKVGWTVLGHLKYRSVKDEDGDEVQLWAPAVNPGLSDGIAQLADLLLEIKRIAYVIPAAKKGNADSWGHKFTLETVTPPELLWTTHELGTRVPMQAEFDIPKVGGIELLEQHYLDAVKAERKNWE